MPLVALLLDRSPAILEYEKRLSAGPMDIQLYIFSIENNSVLLVLIYPILYVFEWSIFNPIFRRLAIRGLKKAGYTGKIIPINRMELIKHIVTYTSS